VLRAARALTTAPWLPRLDSGHEVLANRVRAEAG